MKNSNSFRRGTCGLALAGLAYAAFFTPTLSAVAITHGDKSDHVSEERSLDAFTKILVKGAIDLDLTAGKDQNVEIRTDADRMDAVETYVRGDTLIIDMEDKGRRNFWRSVDVDVTISLPVLEGIEVRGAVDGEVQGIDGGDLFIEIKGAGDLDLEGNCANLELDIKGAGDIDAEGLKCGSVEVDVRGAGSASVYASEEVDANVSGVGSISVYGKPKTVHKKVGGIGSIRIR
jgi:hypothetical protein